MSSLVEKELALTADEKRALLADLLRKKAAEPTKVPLSFAQQRLWLLAQLDPHSAVYNIPRALRLRGELNIDALSQTLNAILARHSVLRGSFVLLEGKPIQQIAPHLEIDLSVVDISHLPESQQQDDVGRRVAEEAKRPFDLTRAPLLRAALIRLNGQHHVLLLTMHHIVSDGWSMGVFVKEMAAIYELIVQERSPALVELPIQYSDFARWQREYLQGEILDQHLGYWRAQLVNAPAALNLPVARPRPAMQTFRGRNLTSTLSQELTDAVVELSRSEGVTLFMTLLAAFQTLLHRYSGQDDIVVGSPIAGRNRPETEDLIGFFVNSLPFRTTLSGNPTFRELLGRVKEVALGAYAHQDLPFEKIVEELQPERSLSYSPIFQVMFALQNQPRAKFALTGLNVELLTREADSAKFDLTWFITETETGLACWIEYNTDLFDKHTVARFLQHYKNLLGSIVANPNRRLSELTLLGDEERNQLLDESSDTQVEFPTNLCMQHLFELQVERTPQAIALACGADRLTYSQLNARANQLARYLWKLGIGPEDRVGICFGRTTEMVIAVLAAMKAGAAYLPLDSAYPRERLAFTLKDSNSAVVLTKQEFLPILPESGARVVCLDAERYNIEQEDESNPVSSVGARNLAYMIYTSGSTGRPKGVAIEHASAVAFLQWAMSTFTPEELAGVLLSTSLSFDLSVFELFAPLSCGGKVIVVENVLHLPTLDSAEVTLINTVPSAMTELVRMGGIPESVTTVNLAGEPVTNGLVQNIYASTNVQQVLNLYGPSEDTTYSTFVRLSRDANDEPSIGRPIANTRAFLLDANLQPLPVRIPGELHLGGAGLARGYWNRPTLTAEKFVPNPFSSKPGGRLYKTGDLAHYNEDGSIQFLGRIDHQVKLRGFRIELGEVETCLREHPGVREAVVVVWESKRENRDLIAYVAADSDPDEVDLTVRLRNFLKSKLPDYMVPAHFVFLDKLPLTLNGKIDRSALPAPGRTRSGLSLGRLAPRDDLEARLARVWKRVLETNSVGVNQNFFELGGHSFLAVRLMAEIENEFARRIPLVSLFQSATIEAQAEILRHDPNSLSWPLLVEIQSGDSGPPLFCVSTPNVNALGYRSLAQYLGADQCVYGLQAQYPEDLEGEHSQAAVDELASEYLRKISEVQPHGPYQLIGMCRGAHIAFEMARRLENAGEKVALVGILDTWVLENTYNKFLYVEYYAHRLRSLLRLGPKDHLEWIKKKRRQRVPDQADEALVMSNGKGRPRANPMHAYFPGPDFKPKTYRSRVSVFRAHRQPLDRIRDKELGWGKLALGGVDLHYVPGQHGASVLSEPHVQVLAAELKQCLLNAE